MGQETWNLCDRIGLIFTRPGGGGAWQPPGSVTAEVFFSEGDMYLLMLGAHCNRTRCKRDPLYKYMYVFGKRTVSNSTDAKQETLFDICRLDLTMIAKSLSRCAVWLSSKDPFTPSESECESEKDHITSERDQRTKFKHRRNFSFSLTFFCSVWRGLKLC